jgi:hypothetical protein
MESGSISIRRERTRVSEQSLPTIFGHLPAAKGVIIACGPGGSVDNVELRGVRAVGNGSPGIWAQCGSKIKVLGGFMMDNSSAGAGGTVGATSGVVFGPNVNRFTVRDLSCGTEPGETVSQKYCVDIQGPNDYYIVKGVDGAGGTTTSTTIADNGLGAHTYIGENF